MATARITRLALRGAVLFGLVGLGGAGCSTDSARADYFASRAMVYPSSIGDGSIVATETGPGGGPWAASLTLVPLSGSGDLADSR